MNLRSKKVTTIVTVSVMIAIVIIGLVTGLTIYFTNKDSNVDSYVVDGDGNALVPGKVHPMPANLIYTDVSPVADESGFGTELILKATIKPDNVKNQKVNWAVEWVNPNSEFATGKQPSTYVAVTPTEDGATTANVVCYRSFGEKIKIVVYSRVNSSAKAECVVDYARKLNSVGIQSDSAQSGRSFSIYSNFCDNIDGKRLDMDMLTIDSVDNFFLSDEDSVNSYVYNYEDDYTIENEIISTSFTFEFAPAIMEYMSTEFGYEYINSQVDSGTGDIVELPFIDINNFSYSTFLLSWLGFNSLCVNDEGMPSLNSTVYNNFITALINTKLYGMELLWHFQLRITVDMKYDYNRLGFSEGSSYFVKFTKSSMNYLPESIEIDIPTMIV